MALAQIEMTVELREISLKDRPKELYDLSSKGTVPVFQFENGEIIDESLDIIFYCVQHKKGQLWIQSDVNQQKQLIKIIDEDFKPWLDKYKYHDRHPSYPRSYYRDKCSTMLGELEILLNHSLFLTGDDLQMVDAAVFPFIRQFAQVDRDWFDTTYKSLSNWLMLIQESPLFINVMQKYDFWQSKNKPLIVNFSGS